MNITKIPKTKPEHMRRLREHRCENTLQSCGSHYFPGRKSQCSRLAVYIVDGKCLCKQHAGDAALAHLLQTECY